MKTNSPSRKLIPSTAGLGDLRGSFLLSYGLGALMIVVLVHFGNVWNVLGNTRLLGPLATGGVVALTDADQGFIHGLPSLEPYVASQDPVQWGLVGLAALIFGLVWALQGLQFHRLTEAAGVEGSFGRHARAHFYGHGINRLFPFSLGDVATASALQGQGVDPEKAAQIVYLRNLFILLELAVFAVIGFIISDPTTWVGEMVYAFLILGVAYLMLRPGRAERRQTRRGSFERARQAFAVLAQDPIALARLIVLSLVAFFLTHVAAYVITQAFTSTNVILNVPFALILTASVAAQVARLVKVTPGGIGQWEWGFAAALYAGGIGFPESVTIALLVSAVRYTTGALIFGAMLMARGAGTDLQKVFALFTFPRPARQEAS